MTLHCIVCLLCPHPSSAVFLPAPGATPSDAVREAVQIGPWRPSLLPILQVPVAISFGTGLFQKSFEMPEDGRHENSSTQNNEEYWLSYQGCKKGDTYNYEMVC